MTALTRLAQARMEERRLLALRCGRCKHKLAQHSLMEGCRHHTVVPHASGNPSKARLRYCKCKGFVDESEKLALNG